MFSPLDECRFTSPHLFVCSQVWASIPSRLHPDNARAHATRPPAPVQMHGVWQHVWPAVSPQEARQESLWREQEQGEAYCPVPLL